MKPGARMKAAVEVLHDVFVRHRPAAEALADWGKSHRFAGSGDRSAIGNLVYDVLRKRSSFAARMKNDSMRALVIAAAPQALGLSVDDVIAAADGSAYALEPMSDAEKTGLSRPLTADAPAHVAGDFPEWLTPHLTRVFGDRAAAEGAALAERAPVDLRINTLIAMRDATLEKLSAFSPSPTPLSPVGVRLPAPRGDARQPNVESESIHGLGWIEVQDEGSQIAAVMADAKPGMTVLDLCAGAGGKTMALAASMENQGKLNAYDRDKRQLRSIFERLKRAGVQNVEVMEGGNTKPFDGLKESLDIVLVDAPCTGSGTWRRRPDAKWRLKPKQLADRISDQRTVLKQARVLVKPGGRLVYVTCSILAEENTDQVAWFLREAPEFSLVPFGDVWRETVGSEPPLSADGRNDALLLTPARHQTDGFFVATLRKRH